ncbi:MAG: nucleotidyl transferase AbiEii/AbiGii toxin family protein [Deltaproteobacteria bacterium]|jgi:hypothetical protein|nr:nucleotidyl transferase AbiEii/AbiGii toxin family protein [Deltaproteobacteria bacterium]
MSGSVKWRTDILPPGQLALWPHLGQIPAEFVLYGGTAAALRFGHRNSADFDFFSNCFPGERLEQMAESLPFMKQFSGQLVSSGDHNRLMDFILKMPSLEDGASAECTVKVTLVTDGEFNPGCFAAPDKVG